MSTEPQTAFKVGFLKKVAELGYTPDEFFAMTKVAFDPADLLSMAGSAGKGLGSALSMGGKALGAAALGAPIVAGGVLGAADAAANAPSTDDVESLRKAEMIGLLRRLTSEVSGRQQKRTNV